MENLPRWKINTQKYDFFMRMLWYIKKLLREGGECVVGFFIKEKNITLTAMFLI